jgi:hypothetical protein
MKEEEEKNTCMEAEQRRGDPLDEPHGGLLLPRPDPLRDARPAIRPR